jgi:hypothetical protein
MTRAVACCHLSTVSVGQNAERPKSLISLPETIWASVVLDLSVVYLAIEFMR